MPTLTPQNRSDEVTWDAFYDGLVTGGLALVPSASAVWLAMRNPKFVKATNWQSRTALVVMPALFCFGYASESKHLHRMREVAQESEHSQEMAKYTTSNLKEIHDAQKVDSDMEQELTELYRASVAQSGVRIVPGDSLNLYQKAANYWQENPFKILAGLGVPTVAWIFYGKAGQEHIPFQLKVMQTRVMGQASVIIMLLTLMGFKEWMDTNGKYITESEANARVEEMRRVREQLILRMEAEKQHIQQIKHEIEEAHEEDVKEGNVHANEASLAA